MAGSPKGGSAHLRGNAARAAEQARQCFELRITGATFAVIAERLGISPSTVGRRVNDHVATVTGPAAREFRLLEMERLDRATVRVFEVLDADHVVCQQGKVVLGEDGRPVRDHMPVLYAIDRLVRLSERRSKLLGLDAPLPVKADVTLTQVEPLDLELTRLLEEARAANAATEAALQGRPDEDEPPAP